MSEMAKGFVQATVLQILREEAPKFLKVARITELASAKLGYAVSAGAVDTACKKLQSTPSLTFPGTVEKLSIGAAAFGYTEDARTASNEKPPVRPILVTPAPPPPPPPPPSEEDDDEEAKRDSGRERPITEVKRPGGAIYRTRVLADTADVLALQKLRAAEIPVILWGPPGSGKTALAEGAFPELVTINGTGGTDVDAFLGQWVPTPEGKYEFFYGPLVTAMREGKVLFIDDATLINPQVLAVLYPAMDGRKRIYVTTHEGEAVDAADGFYVIAGHNPGVHGAILTEALASRFSVHIQVPSDFDVPRASGVDRKAITAAENLMTMFRENQIGWVPQTRELLDFKRVQDVLGLNAAICNLVGTAPEEDREKIAGVLSKVFGIPKVGPLTVGKQV